MSRTPKDPVSQAVAALHDTAENDCARTLSNDELQEAGMPDTVLYGRRVLTRANDETYAEYIDRIRDTNGGAWASLKIADLLSNLADSPSPGQIRRYAKALLVLVPPS